MRKLNSRWNPSNTPQETRSNSIAPGTSSYVPHPSLPPLSSVPQYPPIQPATSTTAPQLERAQDPLASQFNNLRTLPQQDQVPHPVLSSSTSQLQPAMQFPPPQSPMQFQRGPAPLRGISKLLTELTKLYSDQEKKYGGELYDILNSKLRIFYDCCQKVGLEPDQYHNAYSVMLKGRASTFYYDRLAGKGYDFNRMIYESRCHFETEENKQQYMSEWRETTFLRIIATNPGVSRLDCLQRLFDQLQTIQRGLSESYQEDFSLRDQIISACRGVEECNLALFNPANTYEGVCAQLRSSVSTALRSREVQQFNAQLQPTSIDPADQHDHNWTDRTYGGRGRGYSRGYDQRRPRGNRGGPRGGSFQSDRQKKCYVCEKPNCWSTRHSLDERKETYNKFRQ
ncbi:hypothetical protein DM02DRAFT_547142, partial [Periconia macrospinosa]